MLIPVSSAGTAGSCGGRRGRVKASATRQRTALRRYAPAMQDHFYSIVVDGSPEGVWAIFWSQRSGTRTHGGVTIEILHPGDAAGERLVRHCTFPVPKWLLSGGRGVSWEWITEVRPHESWR